MRRRETVSTLHQREVRCHHGSMRSLQAHELRTWLFAPNDLANAMLVAVFPGAPLFVGNLLRDPVRFSLFTSQEKVHKKYLIDSNFGATPCLVNTAHETGGSGPPNVRWLTTADNHPTFVASSE